VKIRETSRIIKIIFRRHIIIIMFSSVIVPNNNEESWCDNNAANDEIDKFPVHSVSPVTSKL
jgi:hypothetical protein